LPGAVACSLHDSPPAREDARERPNTRFAWWETDEALVADETETMMKVFICWSGDTSMQIATQLHGWLPKVHQGIKPFMSHKDIGKGIRWTGALANELEDSNFGLVCLTPENLSAPWLHFEAGALSKIAKSNVAPILFQVKTSDVQGPLRDFQLTTLVDKSDMHHVLKSINDAMVGAEPNTFWEGTFESLWRELEDGINTLVIQDRIQITSPTSGGVLANPQPWLEGFRYEVRGTLRLLPKDHKIWLLNAGQGSDHAKQWPQEQDTVRYNSASGQWKGLIYLHRWTVETFINAVVAPPTAQQLFEYYKQYGGGEQPLSRIPVDCENKAQVFAHAAPAK
jgi:hypothetical protein